MAKIQRLFVVAFVVLVVINLFGQGTRADSQETRADPVTPTTSKKPWYSKATGALTR